MQVGEANRIPLATCCMPGGLLQEMNADLSGEPLNLNDGRQLVMHDGNWLVGPTDPHTLSLPVSNRKRWSSVWS